MAKFKKVALGVVSVALASSMALSLAACKPDGEGGKDDYKFTPYASGKYEEASRVKYDDVLGQFNLLYSSAKAEGTDIAKRFALMAQAEAKLYESGVLLPTQAQGGNYAISKVANRTVSSTAWGNDKDRLHYAMIASTPIKTTDRQAMREYVTEHTGITGAEYLAWMRTYLTEHGYTLKDNYNYTYTSDPATWDVLATSEAADTESIVQTYDGLVEYDVMNIMQPAMATNIPDSVPAEKDGDEDTVTFTFNIRPGQQWVNNTNQKVADFKASDFATGFQHMLDAAAGLEWLVEGVVVGATEYITGTDKDFTKVGVTADDDAMTVTYRVYQSAESYFLTMLSYSVFAPMSKTYYESKGGKFGTQFDPAAESYTYGTSYENIAFCGPYVVSEHTANNNVTFSANTSWWNKDTANARNTTTIKYNYISGEDATETYTKFKSGDLDGCGLTGPNVASAKQDKLSGDTGTIFDTYSYTSAMDSTAFCAFLNVNRGAFVNANDKTTGATTKSEVEKQRSFAALSDVNFRRALVTSVNRIDYMNAVMGDVTLAEGGISNMYTPGSFVSLPEDITITMSGVKKTYPAGTAYGQIVQDQLDIDGMEITVWKEIDGEMKYTGFDGWYNPTFAKAELEKAIATLATYGITVDKDHPIQIDYPFNASRTDYMARANVLKEGIETVLDGKVKLNLVEMDQPGWMAAGYRTNNGSESNYDIYDLSGWGPDFGDPSTYLDTMLPDGMGYMTKCLGLW